MLFRSSGAVFAALLLTILPEALREFSEWRLVVYAITLIVMMRVRPQGLFGIREIWTLGRRRKSVTATSGGAP